MDFMKYAVDACEGFLRSIFSLDFWKQAAGAALLAGFTKGVKSFVETTANVGIGILRSLFSDRFKKHKYDVSDDEEFDIGPSGFSDDFDDDYDDEELDGVAVQHRNLAELAKERAAMQGSRPNEFVDDIGLDGNAARNASVASMFDPDEEDFDEDFDEGEPINVTPRPRRDDPAWVGAYEVLAEAGCG